MGWGLFLYLKKAKKILSTKWDIVLFIIFGFLYLRTSYLPNIKGVTVFNNPSLNYQITVPKNWEIKMGDSPYSLGIDDSNYTDGVLIAEPDGYDYFYIGRLVNELVTPQSAYSEFKKITPPEGFSFEDFYIDTRFPTFEKTIVATKEINSQRLIIMARMDYVLVKRFLTTLQPLESEQVQVVYGI